MGKDARCVALAWRSTKQAERAFTMMTSSAPVVVETLGKITLIHVIGELDIGNYMDFSDALDEAVACSTEPVIVGFVECTYVDTSGLTALVTAHRKYGKRLHVVVPYASRVRRIFEATGLHRALLVHDDFGTAIADASASTRTMEQWHQSERVPAGHHA